jgi:hypothetical protein
VVQAKLAAERGESSLSRRRRREGVCAAAWPRNGVKEEEQWSNQKPGKAGIPLLNMLLLSLYISALALLRLSQRVSASVYRTNLSLLSSLLLLLLLSLLFTIIVIIMISDYKYYFFCHNHYCCYS